MNRTVFVEGNKMQFTAQSQTMQQNSLYGAINSGGNVRVDFRETG